MFEMTINLSGVYEGLSERFGEGSKAQRLWSEMVFHGSEPYMPMVTGTFRNLSTAASKALYAQGELIYPTPYAHYLWEGILYVDPETGKGAFFDEDFGFWSRKGVTKVESDRKLRYNKRANSKAGARWTERAANDMMPAWEKAMQDAVDMGVA